MRSVNLSLWSLVQGEERIHGTHKLRITTPAAVTPQARTKTYHVPYIKIYKDRICVPWDRDTWRAIFTEPRDKTDKTLNQLKSFCFAVQNSGTKGGQNWTELPERPRAL